MPFRSSKPVFLFSRIVRDMSLENSGIEEDFAKVTQERWFKYCFSTTSLLILLSDMGRKRNQKFKEIGRSSNSFPCSYNVEGPRSCDAVHWWKRWMEVSFFSFLFFTLFVFFLTGQLHVWKTHKCHLKNGLKHMENVLGTWGKCTINAGLFTLIWVSTTCCMID